MRNLGLQPGDLVAHKSARASALRPNVRDAIGKRLQRRMLGHLEHRPGLQLLVSVGGGSP